MRIVRFTCFLIIALFLIIGCGNNSDSNSTIQEGAAGGSLIVNVSPGDPTSQPFYSWEDSTINPTAAKIAVARTSAPSTIVWGITSNGGTDTIQSPWQQGTLSSGVTTIGVPTEVDLQTNIEYIVTVTKADNTFGSRKFTILP